MCIILHNILKLLFLLFASTQSVMYCMRAQCNMCTYMLTYCIYSQPLTLISTEYAQGRGNCTQLAQFEPYNVYTIVNYGSDPYNIIGMMLKKHMAAHTVGPTLFSLKLI
jgi:hypothetical protein